MTKRTTAAGDTSPKHSPSICAVPFGVGPPMLRLSARDREHLATIATPMRVDSGTILFRRGEEAHSLYSVVFGTLCTYREGSDGIRRVLAFLFAGDLTGLARRGVYVNTVKAITPASLFRFPMDTLTALLSRDAGLQFRFLCKTTHLVRETQRQAMMITRQDPVERVAMFLSQLEEAQGEKHGGHAILLPMTRQDIADYLNLPVKAITPALAALEHRHIVKRTKDGSVLVVDRRRFDALVSD
jgi:CRP/FNR family transcriptional regulator, nitrogen fixation regulation protein